MRIPSRTPSRPFYVSTGISPKFGKALSRGILFNRYFVRIQES